ncbi:excinuclease ABC subunit UvrA [Candidatus Uhrbacteria bacterium]|nr:excinuclease ABC subunit UvrA [Candidatus Uhrbacteria bacterium]
MSFGPDKITIRGARVHNLKSVNAEIPRGKLTVLTGLSGSGKSSLAFDTIYAEGQRRYVESLSAYARQFLGVMDKPDVDSIEGLSPTISIDQRTVSHNPRSTVGTITEIYDYVRLLFARIGRPHCPQCGREVVRQTIDQIVDRLFTLEEGTRVLLLAPLIRDQKGEHKAILKKVDQAGYSRVRLDGVVYTIDEAASLTVDKQKKHSLEVVVDRVTVDPSERSRIADSAETALDLANGLLVAAVLNDADQEQEVLLFSQLFSCPACGVSIPELEPRNFSFNSPHGACPTCSGLGSLLELDADLIIPNKTLTIAQGAIRPWTKVFANQSWMYQTLERVAVVHGFTTATPVKDLTKQQLDVILYGDGGFQGVIPYLEQKHKETDSEYIRSEIEHYMRSSPCPACHGERLRPEALAVTVAGKNIAVVTGLSIEDAAAFFVSLARATENAVPTTGKGKTAKRTHHDAPVLDAREAKIAAIVLKEITARLTFLQNVGLDYLTLDRAASTLSGGEAQRIRLATQIGSALTGVIYILDEPSIGLHQRDNDKLLTTLQELRDLGNTVIVVEHDEATMRAADYLIDIGPGAGEHGGRIIAAGTPAEIAKHPESLTGKYLSGALAIASPAAYRRGNGKLITIKGATEHNLKNVDVAIPLGKLVCITGVSGSGKSTLMIDILSRFLNQKFYNAKDAPGKHKTITGVEHIDKVIDIDQSPIGRTPRSNPATYTGVFTPMRELYAELPEAKVRGYKAGRFSFNVVGGRCEACQGDGMVKIEMQFLPDVYVECEECHGKRYNREALEIHYKGRHISDVLNMTVEEARAFFATIPAIAEKLEILEEVGLGYVKLGQSATTLSGGEAQRIKLATELSRRATGRTLYILDEPTTGLHFADIDRLLKVLGKLVDVGNTVLVIEHNLDVIKSADWVIDMGPEGGVHGGEVVVAGTPKDIAKEKRSITGKYLKEAMRT